MPHAFCRLAPVGELTCDPDAAPWSALPVLALRDTATAASPDQPTEVRLAWSADELRILFVASDSHPWATLRERDAPLYTEEVVEVFLDPVGDLESYFEFEVNPLNTVLDLVLRRTRSGVRKDFAWQCEKLRSRVILTATGWNTEISIPFRSLVAELPRPGDRWRANFCRIDRPADRERELTAWSPTGLKQFHVPERFGVLEFVT